MRKVTVWRMRERYAQTVLTFRITYLKSFHLSSNQLPIARPSHFQWKSNLICQKPTAISLQSYQSVLQVTSLWATSLTQLVNLNASLQPSLVSMKISLTVLFIVLFEDLLVLGCCHFQHLLLSTALQLFVQSFGLPNHFLPSSSILDKSLPVWHF